jgi:hypothetical protein
MNPLGLQIDELKSLVYGTALIGFMLGGLRGGRRAARRFTVENMACPPKTRGDLLFFVRQRNGRMLAGVVTEGVKMASSFSLVSFAYGLSKSAWESFLQMPVLPEVCAAMGTGALSMGYAGGVPKLYYIRRGAGYGLAAGLLLGGLRYLHDRGTLVNNNKSEEA